MIESILFLKLKNVFTGISIEQDRGQGHVFILLPYVLSVGFFLRKIIYRFVYIGSFVMKQTGR